MQSHPAQQNVGPELNFPLSSKKNDCPIKKTPSCQNILDLQKDTQAATVIPQGHQNHKFGIIKTIKFSSKIVKCIFLYHPHLLHPLENENLQCEKENIIRMDDDDGNLQRRMALCKTDMMFTVLINL